MKKIFVDYGYSRDMFHCRSFENSLVDALIIESFLGNTEKIQEIIALIQKYFVNKRSGELNYDAKKGISDAFEIFLDYDDIKNIEILINKIKDSYLLTDEFHEFLLKANDFKKLKVFEMLLSSGVDVNQVTDRNGTIKDRLLMRRSIEKQRPLMQRTIKDNKEYILAIDALLDKYGAITYETLLANRFKKIIGSIAVGIGIIACFLFYSKYLYS